MARKALIFAVILAVGLCFTAPASQAQTFLRMFSGPEGGSWYPLGSAMMSILDKNLKGVSTSNGPGGGVGNCKAVNAGRADMGWSYTHTAYNAYEGKGEFDKKNTNLRHLMSLYPGVFQMAAPRDSDIKTPADLANKRIVPGKTGFTGTVIAENVLKAYGITFDSVKKNGGSVSFVGYADSAALMKDGHSDCYMAVTSCPQSTIIDLNFRPGIRLLPIDEEHMKKILELEPGMMATVIPKTAYKDMDADVPAVGTVTCIVINKDVPDDMAYQIVKTFYDHWDELKQVKQADIEASPPEEALRGVRIPVHPGALKYYKEKGWVK